MVNLHQPNDFAAPNKRITFDASHVFNELFNCVSMNENISIGWNLFSINGFKEFIADKPLFFSLSEARQSCIDYIVTTTFENNYGCGGHYELYEERRQNSLAEIIEHLTISEAEMIYFKEKSEFCDDMWSFAIPCEDCKSPISSLEEAHSLQVEGRSLCAQCLNSCYM